MVELAMDKLAVNLGVVETSDSLKYIMIQSELCQFADIA